MTRRIGIALGATLALLVPTAISPAVATPAAGQKVTASGATDVDARRHRRRSHYVYHPYYPYYLGRPYYYSPGSFLPFPSLVDDGWGSW